MISLDSNAADLLNSPNWIQDQIDDLNTDIADLNLKTHELKHELAECKQALAVAYAQPENDRRKVHDGPNVTLFETCCRIIEPTAKLYTFATGFWVKWDGGETELDFTPQDAWRTAFSILDRRQKSEVAE